MCPQNILDGRECRCDECNKLLLKMDDACLSCEVKCSRCGHLNVISKGQLGLGGDTSSENPGNPVT